MPKKFLIVDDEPVFMEPIFERIKLEFGEEVFFQYFQSANDVVKYLKANGLTDVSGVILDLTLNISNNIQQEVILGGLIIAKRIREIDTSIPIAYFSLFSEEPVIADCLLIPNTIFISKTDSEGMEKLINFISSIKSL